jgi:hypothetical protein
MKFRVLACDLVDRPSSVLTALRYDYSNCEIASAISPELIQAADGFPK